jgi:Uma2 family endonuclease
VVEILTKWSKDGDTLRKRESYYKAGVHEFWVIDLEGKSVVVENFQMGLVKRYGCGDTVKSWAFELISFDADEIFEG